MTSLDASLDAFGSRCAKPTCRWALPARTGRRQVPYANICEQCLSFHTDSTHLGILSAQRIDSRALVADVEFGGWIDEVERHHALIDGLQVLISQVDGA